MALSDLSLSLHSVLIYSKDLPDTASLSSAIALAPASAKHSIGDLELFACWTTKVGWLDHHVPSWRSAQGIHLKISTPVTDVMDRFSHAAPETSIMSALTSYVNVETDTTPFKNWLIGELNLGEIRAELAKLDVEAEVERQEKVPL